MNSTGSFLLFSSPTKVIFCPDFCVNNFLFFFICLPPSLYIPKQSCIVKILAGNRWYAQIRIVFGEFIKGVIKIKTLTGYGKNTKIGYYPEAEPVLLHTNSEGEGRVVVIEDRNRAGYLQSPT